MSPDLQRSGSSIRVAISGLRVPAQRRAKLPEHERVLLKSVHVGAIGPRPHSNSIEALREAALG